MSVNHREIAIRRSPSPSEIRRMTPAERDAIIEAQVAEAEEEYRTNRELTAFEAFGQEDGPHVDDATTEPR